MTVQKDVTKNIYVGNGSTRTFPFTFECPAEHQEYIKVYLMQDDGTALATSDYQLDMDARQITYPSSGAALPEGKKLVIMRELPLQQMMNLVNNGPYFAEDVELAFDENVMAMQQIAEKLNRSIIMSVDIDGDAFVNEVPFEAGKSFRIADDGKSIVLTEDPARVLPLAQEAYAQAQAQAQSAYSSAAAAAKSEDSAAASASEAGNSAQSASVSAASAAESARLAEGYKNVAETAKSDAALYANNAKTSADNATASKEAAQSAANSASNFATDARSSANEAKSYRDAASTYATDAKNYSENVNVFEPSVSADGILSWTNKAGLPNPPSVNIKGKDGADGGVTVDDTLSDTSTNAIQNKVVKAALDNRAVLDENNIFTSPNNFADIYMEDGMSSLKWFNGSPNFVVASINSKRYTGEANTAKKATKDGDGNIITSTYATKTELNSCVKSVNNVTPDTNGNVNITVSGGGGSNITVDAELSDTSKNPVQNKVVKAALDKRALLDESNVFTNQNLFIYGVNLQTGTAGGSAIKWYSKDMSTMVASLSDTNYTGTAQYASMDSRGYVIHERYAAKVDVEAALSNKLDTTGTAEAARKDGEGNTISLIYAKKADVEVDLNNKLNKLDTAVSAKVAEQAFKDGDGNYITSTYVKSVNNVTPDSNGNVSITVSGGGSSATVDTTLSSTSTNAIQNKAVYAALNDKLGKSDIAIGAQRALQDGDGNTITLTYVKSVNGAKPDNNGNVDITVSGSGGVSTSESNTWTGKQTFKKMKFNFESYNAPRVSGATDNPSASVAVYNVQGNFTLDMSVLAGLLNNGDATLFTAYITANGAYTLSITNAGTLKYVGNASDLAITVNGLLLNILLIKSSSGDLSSVVQANALT